MVISINKAEYTGGYKIRVSFSDGTVQMIDFFDFLNTAKNPMTKNILMFNCLKINQLSMGILSGMTTKCASRFGIYTKEKFRTTVYLAFRPLLHNLKAVSGKSPKTAFVCFGT